MSAQREQPTLIGLRDDCGMSRGLPEAKTYEPIVRASYHSVCIELGRERHCPA